MRHRRRRFFWWFLRTCETRSEMMPQDGRKRVPSHPRGTRIITPLTSDTDGGASALRTMPRKARLRSVSTQGPPHP